MDSRLQHISACLMFLSLALSCCLAQVPITTRLCDQLSAGGYTYNLSSLGTITLGDRGSVSIRSFEE